MVYVIERFVICLSLFIVLMALLTGCGDQKFKVEGNVLVEHRIELTDLTEYFTQDCKQRHPSDFCYDKDPTKCAACLVGDFVNRRF